MKNGIERMGENKVEKTAAKQSVNAIQSSLAN